MELSLGYHTAGVVLGAIGAATALALAVVVLRAGSAARVNRRLALLLFADALFAIGSFVSIVFADPDSVSPTRLVIGAMVVFDAMALLAFLGTLDSPLGRALGSGRGTLGIVTLGVLAMGASALGVYRGASVLGFGNIEGPTWIALAIVSVAALFVSLDAYRRTERGTVGHRRSAAAAAAFITRDVITALFVVGWAVSDVRGSLAGKAVAESLGGVSIMAFCLLLTYGILRTQVYDIDLRVRWGIQKGTMVGVIVATAFVGEKLAEQILSREFGWVIGSILAGLLVFAAPRLNKLGDKVATTAMPKVEATPAYVHFKKLEVYKAAVESAVENDGVIDERERAMLDRLRAKLGVSGEDARAIEVELSADRSTATSAAVPS